MFIKEIYKKYHDEIKRDNKPKYREKPICWPSESSVTVDGYTIGECKRALFYKFIGMPYSDLMPVRVRKICNSGIMYEDYAINEYKQLNKYLIDQTRIEIKPETTNDIIISGKVDCIIKDDTNQYAIEMKSVEGYKAQKVFGKSFSGKNPLPLPAGNNLMQAMQYKYYTLTNPIEGYTIDKVYLQYINRGDGTYMFFEIDLDEQGYAIITAIDEEGNIGAKINMQDVLSFNDILNNENASGNSESARLSELRFSVYDIFGSFDQTYSYVKEKVLPPKDYVVVYDDDEIEKQLKLGKISKQKYNKHKSGDKIGDSRCSFCNFRSKCQKE